MRNLFLVVLIAFLLSLTANCSTLEEKIAKDYDLAGNRISLIATEGKIRQAFLNGRAADLATQSIEAVVYRAADALENKGYHEEATQIVHEWNFKFRGMVYEIRDAKQRPVGDHPGVIWLLDIHTRVSKIIGEDICHALRIHDLWNFGMTIGVVFRCQDGVPAAEYFEHFSLFAGCVAYWVADIACMFVSPIPFICGFAGMGVERLVILFVVPRLESKCYSLACNKENH